MKYYLLILLFFVATSTSAFIKRDSETFVLNGEKSCGSAKCDLVTADSLTVGSHTTKA
ncbi:22809_t:CDS:1, partial [Dentiscutata erythropus]